MDAAVAASAVERRRLSRRSGARVRRARSDATHDAIVRHRVRGRAPVKTRRATRFELPRRREDGEATRRFLFRAFERASEGANEGANDERATVVDSLERQMRMLRLRVPRYFTPTGRATRDERDANRGRGEKCNVARARVAVEAATHDDIAAGEPSYGLGQMGGGASWEMIHLALLKTTLVPLMRERMKTMDRRARRVYERTFDITPEPLRLRDVPHRRR